MRFSLSYYIATLLATQLTTTRATAVDLESRAKSAAIKVYSVPQDVAQSNSFEVKVRTPGGKWHSVESYKVQVVQTNVTTGSAAKKDSSMISFDFKGPVEVSATYNNGQIKTSRVRPDSFGIIPKQRGNTVKFSLDRPRNVVLQVNGDIFDVLHIFSNPIEEDAPTASGTDLVYYGPGLHVLNQPINITSGQTVYVAGGAVVRAPGINFDSVQNATLRGGGVLAASASSAISVMRSKNILYEGLIGINVLPRAYASEDVVFQNIRAMSAVTWGDGIDVFCSKNVLLDNVFLRTSDDSVALYNHRDQWYGDNSNITLQNSILWADVAHPINMATHGNTENPEKTDGVVIRNIDILDHHEKQVDYQGTIAINAGDSNLVQNVLIDDVRVEDFRLGQLINLRVMFNDKYNTSPGRGIRNVTIKNLAYKGDNSLTSLISGYDAERPIDGVTFQNLTVNGLVIHDKMQKPGWYRTSDYVPMIIGPHVKNVVFNQ